MSFVSNLKTIYLKFSGKISRNRTYHRYKKNINIKHLTIEQKIEIAQYYKDNFGVKVNPKFHEILFSMTGIYKKEFMPIEIYDKLIEKLSPWDYRKILDDKVLYEWLLPGIRIPERIGSACNGVFFIYSGGGIDKK